MSKMSVSYISISLASSKAVPLAPKPVTPKQTKPTARKLRNEQRENKELKKQLVVLQAQLDRVKTHKGNGVDSVDKEHNKSNLVIADKRKAVFGKTKEKLSMKIKNKESPKKAKRETPKEKKLKESPQKKVKEALKKDTIQEELLKTSSEKELSENEPNVPRITSDIETAAKEVDGSDIGHCEDAKNHKTKQLVDPSVGKNADSKDFCAQQQKEVTSAEISKSESYAERMMLKYISKERLDKLKTEDHTKPIGQEKKRKVLVEKKKKTEKVKTTKMKAEKTTKGNKPSTGEEKGITKLKKDKKKKTFGSVKKQQTVVDIKTNEEKEDSKSVEAIIAQSKPAEEGRLLLEEVKSLAAEKGIKIKESSVANVSENPVGSEETPKVFSDDCDVKVAALVTPSDSGTQKEHFCEEKDNPKESKSVPTPTSTKVIRTNAEDEDKHVAKKDKQKKETKEKKARKADKESNKKLKPTNSGDSTATLKVKKPKIPKLVKPKISNTTALNTGSGNDMETPPVPGLVKPKFKAPKKKKSSSFQAPTKLVAPVSGAKRPKEDGGVAMSLSLETLQSSTDDEPLTKKPTLDPGE